MLVSHRSVWLRNRKTSTNRLFPSCLFTRNIRRNIKAASIALVALVICTAMSLPSSAQTLTTLASFDRTHGALPHAPLIQGTDGNFYGTTMYGGPTNVGTVFKVTPGGTLTDLHDFVATDGMYPMGSLLQMPDGRDV